VKVSEEDLKSGGVLGVARKGTTILAATLLDSVKLAIFSMVLGGFGLLAVYAYEPAVAPEDAATAVAVPFMILALCVRLARTRWAPLHPAELLERQRPTIWGALITTWVFTTTALIAAAGSACAYWAIELPWAHHLACLGSAALATMVVVELAAIGLAAVCSRMGPFRPNLSLSVRLVLGVPDFIRHCVKRTVAFGHTTVSSSR